MGSGILGIGVSSLSTTRQALATIGQNIANSNTDGYSRQETSLITRPSQYTGGGYIGNGVSVDGTRRVVDVFLTDLVRSNSSAYGSLSSYLDFSESVDNLFADAQTGISSSVQGFFGSMHDLVNEPSSMPKRQVLISQADILESRFNTMQQELVRTSDSLNSKTHALVTEINTLSEQIAGLNVNIVAASGQTIGTQPNDLLDKRDELVKELSSLVSVTQLNESDGSASIFIGNGLNLVLGGQASTLQTASNPDRPGSLHVQLVTGSSIQTVTNNLEGGELTGLYQVRDEVVEPAMNSLNRLAVTIAAAFNQQHQLGVDLNGTLGQNLFNDINSASSILDRAIASSSNSGNGVISATILPIEGPPEGTVKVYNTPSTLVNVGTLTTLTSNGHLSLNGIDVRATTAADDTVSPAGDAAASAIAIANAINASTSAHRVTATAEPNHLYLGAFTAGAFAAGEFQINGVNVVTTGADSATLVQDINALSLQTGVRASASGNEVTLTTADGRNIQLTSNTNTPVATFAHFDTNSATALNQVQRSTVKLSSDARPITVGGTAPGNAAFSAATTPQALSTLTTSEYDLSLVGSVYTLTRLSDNVIVASSGTLNGLSADGFRLNLESGTIQSGDTYRINPIYNGASNFTMQISDPTEIALGMPVSATAPVTNNGTAAITVTEITNTTGTPASTTNVLGNAFGTAGQLSPPLKIEFVNATTYRIFDMTGGVQGAQIGPDQSYDPATGVEVFPLASVTDATGPGPNAPYVYDPGYRLAISGIPSQGDTFDIGYNTDAVSDNRNAVKLTGLEQASVMEQGNATFSESYAATVGEIGTFTQQAQVKAEAGSSLLQQAIDRKDALSGVNLDEEAANLLKFEQAYQASAQLITVARSVFQSLMGIFN